MNDANKALEESIKEQKKNRKRRCIILIMVIVLAVIVVTMLFWFLFCVCWKQKKSTCEQDRGNRKLVLLLYQLE